MDTELYQILSLALLGLIVLVLLAVLASLGNLRKAVGERRGLGAAAEGPREPRAEMIAEEPADLTAAQPEPTPEPEPSATPAEGLGAAGFGPAPGSEPAPSFSTTEPAAAPEPQPAAETPSAEPKWDEVEEKFASQYRPPDQEQPATAEPAPSGTGVEGAATAAPSAGYAQPEAQEPQAQEPQVQEPQVQEPQAQEPQVQEPQVQEEPQEQPFERDGKWFFRRGDELLTYEETTGQWVPAGGTPAAQPGAPAPAAEQEQDTQQFETTGVSEVAEEPAEATSTGGGFWKCPSCGAVNGSTATTCRMCFTARP